MGESIYDKISNLLGMGPLMGFGGIDNDAEEKHANALYQNGGGALTAADLLSFPMQHATDYGSMAAADAASWARPQFAAYGQTMAPQGWADKLQTPSIWDKVVAFGDDVEKFRGSGLGKLAGATGGGLLAYMDYAKRKKIMQDIASKQMAFLDAQNAKAAKYDPAVYYDNQRSAAPSGAWGAGQSAFANNTIRMPVSTSKAGYFAEGGQPQPQKTGVLGALGALLGLDQRTEEQRKAEEKERARRARMTPSEQFNEDTAAAFQKDIVRTGQPTPKGYMAGGTSGQSDKIPAMLSDGEFVMDADTVSALGDGNNAAGASALEQMRQNIRKHKRAAPVNKIPPKAKKPEAYLKKGK